MVLKSTGLSFPAQPPDFAKRVSLNAVSCSIILLKIYWTISVQYVKVPERFHEVKPCAKNLERNLTHAVHCYRGLIGKKFSS
jgi:hypothetical protein